MQTGTEIEMELNKGSKATAWDLDFIFKSSLLRLPSELASHRFVVTRSP